MGRFVSILFTLICVVGVAAITYVEYGCSRFGIACSLSSTPPSEQRVIGPNARSANIRLSEEPDSFIGLQYRIASGLFGGDRLEVIALFEDANLIVSSIELNNLRFNQGDTDSLRTFTGAIISNSNSRSQVATGTTAGQLILVAATDQIIVRKIDLEIPSDIFAEVEFDVRNINFSTESNRLSFDVLSDSSSIFVQGREVRLARASRRLAGARRADRVAIQLTDFFEIEVIETSEGVDMLSEINIRSGEYQDCLEDKPEAFRSRFPERSRGFVTCWTWIDFSQRDVLNNFYQHHGRIVYSVIDVRESSSTVLVDRNAGANVDRTGTCIALMDSDVLIATGPTRQWVIYGCRFLGQELDAESERNQISDVSARFEFLRTAWADPVEHTIECDCSTLWFRDFSYDGDLSRLRIVTSTNASELVIDGLNYPTGIESAVEGERPEDIVDVVIQYNNQREPRFVSVNRRG